MVKVTFGIEIVLIMHELTSIIPIVSPFVTFESLFKTK